MNALYSDKDNCSFLGIMLCCTIDVTQCAFCEISSQVAKVRKIKLTNAHKINQPCVALLYKVFLRNRREY